VPDALPPRMKAVVLRRFGGPDALELLDWPRPEPAGDEVLIRVCAVTVGRALDVEVREHGAAFRVTLPRILGADPAGVVVATGPRARRFAVGDRVVSTSCLFCGHCSACARGDTHVCDEHRVVGVHIDGGDADYCRVPEGTLLPIPDHVAFDQAASMGVSYPMAWNLLRHTADVQPGEDVLVMGAGGALGIAGILVARALGARVIAAAAADWKLERCRALLGADEVVNYSRSGWTAEVRARCADPRGVAVVYENISAPALFGDALSLLAPQGRLVTAGSAGGGVVPVDMRTVYRGHLRIFGATAASVTMAEQVCALVAQRRLEPPPVFHRYPLSEVAAAHVAAAGRELFGRAVLIPATADQPDGEPDVVSVAAGATRAPLAPRSR
jgi:NADPH:quinone reductase